MDVTIAANSASIHHPPQEVALRLLRERFLNRTDQIAVLMPWDKPSPVEPMGSLDELLLAHLLGDAGPAAKVRYRSRNGEGFMKGHFRLGAFAPALDGTTKWLCLDFDGGEGHANALADPQGSSLEAMQSFAKAGFPSHLERSKSGKGWHLWCFFDKPIEAAKARTIAQLLAPANALLVSGAVADARRGHGIEIFPKQEKVRRGKAARGFGNLVWLPWYAGATEGGNVFYRLGSGGALEPFAPTELAAVSREVAEDFVAAHGPTEQPKSASTRKAPGAREAPGTAAAVELADLEQLWAEVKPAVYVRETLGDWKRAALEALSLPDVYGDLLTGGESAGGWLQCRDPSSPSGDRNPSAGVATGQGDAERGSFHSFRTGETLDVFDYLQRHGGCLSFSEAVERVSRLTGVALPASSSSAPTTPTSAANPGARGAPAASSSQPAASAAPPTAPPARKRATTPAPPARSTFRVEKGQGHLAVAHAVQELAKAPMVFQRNNRLVTVLADDGEPDQATTIRRERGAPVIAYLPVPSLWELLSKHISWTKYDARVEGYVDCDPPKDVVAAVHARGYWPKLRSLQGITTSPLLRADGSIFDQPGYDAATGFLYFPTGPTQPIPDAPTREDALAALDQLLEVVCDFEFATPAHQAGWIAALLTPLARATYQGNTPLFLIDANTARSGKSRLCDCISLIVANKTMARSRFTLDDDEQEKRCMTHLQAGDPVVLFDNVAGAFGGTTLDALLTSEGWFSGRLLGKNGADARLSVRNLTVWFATANNATLAGDLFGRCVHVRLESTHEHPEERTGFMHADLLGWVREARPRLLAAALTILRAWFVAGKPRPDMPNFGSFEAWSGVIRSICLWLGLPDPWADTRRGIREADPATSLHAQLLEGWIELDPECRGLTAGEATRRLEADISDAHTRSRPPTYLKLADALGAVGLLEDGKVNAQRLGKRLQSFKNKRLNGCWFERVQDKNANVGRWRVVRECGDSRESVPSLYRNCQNDRNDISIEGKVANPGHRNTPGASSGNAGSHGEPQPRNGQLDLLQIGLAPSAPVPAQAAPVAPAPTSHDDEGGL